MRQRHDLRRSHQPCIIQLIGQPIQAIRLRESPKVRKHVEYPVVFHD
jgi:hypothetical protein